MAQKLLHLDITHKKSETPSQKISFECRLEDLLTRLSVWTAV